jgi:hypothetical protein
MTSIREEFITARFNEWLDRFTPPRGIINNLDAQQRDANAMLATVLRFAPRHDYGDWLPAMLIRLEEAMTTRSWPAPGEVAKACKTETHGAPGGGSQLTEAQAVDRMADWYGKFQTQLPGHGRDTRTAELIRRGTLANEREARFRGFSLSPDMARTAATQRPSRDEWRHHVGVMARLRGVDEAEVEMQIRAEFKDAPAVDRSTPIPDKTANMDWVA